jgi:PIN domain nuclease of toxin-antitoxin system
VIVLDTHVWWWWTVMPDRLSTAAAGAIESAETIGVPTICCWEIGLLANKRRIALDRPLATWVRQALSAVGVRSLMLTPEIAVRAALLDEEGFHGDPADRIIYATARHERAKLITRDQRLHAFDPRAVVW